MPQSFASVHEHIIFSTKHREPRIEAAWSPRLYDYIGSIVRERKCRLLGAGGMPDHVHLMVSFGRENAIADLVRDMKSGSSRFVHESIAGQSEFAWQAGYAAFGVSQSNLGDVLAYINHQAEHHRGRTFQDEYRELLRKHDLEFDERYVWD